ncbi:MAG: FtsX-like permease family protein, partial [Gemmatimonadetes bacterium]|nr:FtsX-like permease family protein [Gemmatimonadota bacterium]
MAGSDGDFSAGIDAGLAAVAQDEIPGVEAAARVGVVGSWIQRGDKSLHQTLCRADVSVFEMFDLQLVAGDPRHVLAEPGSMVLTEAAAKRYFGAEDPVGAMVTIGAGVTGIDYLITGIVRNMPKHAHLRFDFMTASPLKAGAWEGWRDSWHPFEVYLLLREGVGAPDVESAMPAIIARFKGAQFTANSTYRLQQLNRIHLYSTVDFGMPTAGDIGQLRIVSLVGLFILLIACSNFTNLATARSAHRAREVGLRKVLGARRMQLAAQFTGEAILISFAALLLSILLAWQALPLFSHIGLGQISSEALLDPTLALVMVGLTLCVGALAGCYPASVLSALQPATVLKT